MLYAIGRDEFDFVKIETGNIVEKDNYWRGVIEVKFDLPNSDCTFYNNEEDARTVLNEINERKDMITFRNAIFDTVENPDGLKVIRLIGEEC